MFQRGSIAREATTAVAVLTIYLLTLLLPLHQAASLQRDLGTLGYAPLDTWSICASLAQHDHGDTPTAVKCPAASFGKNTFAGVLPASIAVEIPTAFYSVSYAPASFAPARSIWEHSGQARAPPVTG